MTVKQRIRQLPQYTEKEFIRRREEFLDLGYDGDNATRLAYWSFAYPRVQYEKLYDYLESVENE